MRVLIAGDRYWPCHILADAIVRRLAARHREALTVVMGDSAGIVGAFTEACARLEVRHETHPAFWDDLTLPDAVIRLRFDGTKYDSLAGARRDEAMIGLGAGLCLVVHRNLKFSHATKHFARRTLAAKIPTSLIASTLGNQEPLRANDPRLR